MSGLLIFGFRIEAVVFYGYMMRQTITKIAYGKSDEAINEALLFFGSNILLDY